jgi:hypothetical protein
VTQDTQTAFFSYCRQDSDFALRLAEDLKAAGASVWLDQLNILPGQRWDRAVEEALTNCRRMVVILSPAAVSSTNVMDEVSFALEEQKTVIPAIYQDCTVPFRLRRVQFVDFRQDYARGLQVVLKILAPGQSAGQSKSAIADAESQIRPSVSDADERQHEAEQARLEEERQNVADLIRPEKERNHAEWARVEEEHKRAEEARLEDERRKAAERARLEEEREQAAEQARVEEERRRVAEEASLEDEGRNAEAEAERTTPGSQPTEQTTLKKFLKIGALAILASLLFFVAVIVWDLLKFG